MYNHFEEPYRAVSAHPQDSWTTTETELRAKFRGNQVILDVSPRAENWHERTLSDYFPMSPMAVKDADMLGSILRGLVTTPPKAIEIQEFLDFLKLEHELIYAAPEPYARELLLEVFRGNYLSYRRDGSRSNREKGAYPYPYHLALAAAFRPYQDRGFWRWFLAMVSADRSIVENIINTFSQTTGLNPAEKLFVEVLRKNLDLELSPRDPEGPYTAFCTGLSLQCAHDIQRVLDMKLPRMDRLNALIRTIAFHFMVYFIRLAHEFNTQTDLFFNSLATGDWDWIDSEPSCFDCTKPEHLEEVGPELYLHLSSDRISLRAKTRTSYGQVQESVYRSFFDFACFRTARTIFEQATGKRARDYRDIGKAIRDDAEFSAFFHEGTYKYTQLYFQKHATYRTGLDWEDVSEWLKTSVPLHIFHEAMRRYYLKVTPSNRTPQTGGPNALVQLDQIVGLSDIRPRVGRYWSPSDELLLLITHFAVPRDMKQPLRHVLDHFKRYGLHFDQPARSHMINKLNSLGMLQKYSDSGEAIYVRSLF